MIVPHVVLLVAMFGQLVAVVSPKSEHIPVLPETEMHCWRCVDVEHALHATL